MGKHDLPKIDVTFAFGLYCVTLLLNERLFEKDVLRLNFEEFIELLLSLKDSLNRETNHINPHNDFEETEDQSNIRLSNLKILLGEIITHVQSQDMTASHENQSGPIKNAVK